MPPSSSLNQTSPTKKQIDPRQKAQRELKRRGFSLAGYARANKFNIYTFRMWLRGEWGSGEVDGEVSAKFLAALKRDGVIR